MWKNVSYYYSHRRKGRNWFKIGETMKTSSIWRFLTVSKWIIHSVCQKYPAPLSYSGTESTNSEAAIAPCSIQLVFFSFWARGRALFPGSPLSMRRTEPCSVPSQVVSEKYALAWNPSSVHEWKEPTSPGPPRGRPAAKHMLLSTGKKKCVFTRRLNFRSLYYSNKLCLA